MNFDNPSDLSPLSYGAGLALGLALVLGLPGAPTAAVSPRSAKMPGDRFATSPTPVPPSIVQPLRFARER